MTAIIPLALLFVLFWFALIRPQRARAREQQALIRSLEVGDEIVTAGGLYGVIQAVDGEVLHVEIAEGLVVRTARNAVAGVVEEVEDEDEDAVEPADDSVEEIEAAPGEAKDPGYPGSSS